MARNYIPLTYEFVEESEELSDAEFGRLIRQGYKYATAGEPIALSGNERFFAKRLMNQIDRYRQNYEEVCDKRKEAGRLGAEARWQKMANAKSAMANDSKNGQTETKTETKTNIKKDIHISPRKIADDTVAIQAKEVIDYLNEKTGTKYRYSESSLRHIRARLNEKYSVTDCKTVIDKKAAEWMGDAKMQQYLRPETLFGSKFENYLNAPEIKPKGEVLPDWYDANPKRGDQKKATAEEIEATRALLMRGEAK